MEKTVICCKSFNDIPDGLNYYPSELPVFCYDRDNISDFTYGSCYTVLNGTILSDLNRVFERKQVKQYFLR